MKKSILIVVFNLIFTPLLVTNQLHAEETDADTTAASTDGGSSDNGTTTSDDASLAALIWDQGAWGTHKWQ